jgi:hypothetical protein
VQRGPHCNFGLVVHPTLLLAQYLQQHIGVLLQRNALILAAQHVGTQQTIRYVDPKQHVGYSLLVAIVVDARLSQQREQKVNTNDACGEHLVRCSACMCIYMRMNPPDHFEKVVLVVE